MIRKITGTIVQIYPQRLVVEVNGIGYLLYVPRLTGALYNETHSFHTHLAVRENALDLYGFETQQELEVFELLLTLQKIGPKSALQILTQADIATLEKAVIENDPDYLSKMSGLGKKTAEKVVSGLKERFEILSSEPSGILNEKASDTRHLSDAIDALVSLGYPQSDARRTVQSLPSTHTNANDLVREALKILST